MSDMKLIVEIVIYDIDNKNKITKERIIEEVNVMCSKFEYEFEASPYILKCEVRERL